MSTKFKNGSDDMKDAEKNQLQVDLSIYNGFKPLVFLGRILGVFNRNAPTLQKLKRNKT